MIVTSRTSSNAASSRREGVVLLVVIALLALFASLALTFVFYAESTAIASQYAIQAQTLSAADAEPELLLNYFLGQLIYDTDDPYSALRGASLARTMYGYNPAGRNDQAFSGHGRLRYPLVPGGPDRYQAINHQYHDADGFFHDPERYGARAVINGPQGQYVAEGGAPWTYPDENSLFLAAVSAGGEVLLPSYNRPWTFNPSATFDPSLPANQKWLKYLTLRPHPSHHPQFVTPDSDPGGDVKNLDWGRGVPYLDATGKKVYANNDSIWLDLGFPVRTAADGRKFKPLFAPLIMDLDNRVNLWAAGGSRSSGALVGNQGWGRWEINPRHALANVAEFPNLFVGSGGVPGRLGANADPEGTRAAIMGPPAWYARYDFDGTGTGKATLPAAGSVFGFPSYPAGWDSGSAAELLNHPFIYNYFQPGVNMGTPANSDAKPPALSNMEAQLRLLGKGSLGFTSDLFKLLPSNMANSRTRNLTTLLSFDFNKPGLLPYYTNDPAFSSPYGYDAPRGYPITPSQAFPSPNPMLPPGPPAVNSEFTSNWRSKLADLTRINLHRPLRDYPTTVAANNPGNPNPNPNNPPPVVPAFSLQALDTANAAIVQAYSDALSDRQNFARDIYQMLVQATGAQDPNALAGGLPKTDPRFQAARWLAQLAVNIVDYIDNDDFATPFIWYKDPSMPNDASKWESLFGVELPKLVLNEFYGQLDNDPNDNSIDVNDLPNSKASKYRVNCWVELHNPFQDTPSGNVQDYPLDGGSARLKVGANIVHRIIVSRPDPSLRAFDNLTGSPDPAKQIFMFNDWDGPTTLPKGKGKGKGLIRQLTAAQQKVFPGNGYYAVADGSNVGFFAVGPTFDDYTSPPWTGRDPNLPTSFHNDQMSAVIGVLNPPTELTVILQRLACPYLPPDNNPASVTFNPYITVDIMDSLALNQRGYYDGRLANDVGPVAMNPPAPTAWASWGRRQPCAGLVNQGALQDPVTQAANQPKHTFFRHNAREDAKVNGMTGFDNTTQPNPATPGQTITTPFTWLFHLDRRPINSLELLHTAGCRNHELTNQFINAAGQTCQHYVPWLVADALLYRFFELSYAPDLMNGVSEKGRTPGKININTIWDIEVFRALCDANAATNNFTLTDVDNLWANGFLPSRTPGKLPDGTMQLGGGDRPFWPFGVGYTTPAPGSQYPNGLSIQNTLLRDQGAGKLFFGSGHPYQQYELLTKIYNNVTTRSNCFAVYLTVGFFEVMDDTARPVKLGQELGRAEGRHIRHRMFTLVDRTELRVRKVNLATGTEINLTTAAPIAIPPGQLSVDSVVAVPSLSYDTMNGRTWTIQPGTQLVFGAGLANEETVVVKSTNPGAPPSLVATFTKNHVINEPIICRSNMGPWPRYNARLDARVVPHFSVID